MDSVRVGTATQGNNVDSTHGGGTPKHYHPTPSLFSPKPEAARGATLRAWHSSAKNKMLPSTGRSSLQAMQRVKQQASAIDTGHSGRAVGPTQLHWAPQPVQPRICCQAAAHTLGDHQSSPTRGGSQPVRRTRKHAVANAAVLAVAERETSVATPAYSAHQLLQTIASSTDWKFLQDLYQKNHSIMTTAHVAAIAMQLPKASLHSNGIVFEEGEAIEGCVLSDGLQALYMEIMPRLEGQLHVLPARLLLGVASALEVCGVAHSSSWRAAFLSAAATLVAPTLGATSNTQIPGQSAKPAQPCSPCEVLALSTYVSAMYSAPGSSDEALNSAALTERLVTVLRAAAITCSQANVANLPAASAGNTKAKMEQAALAAEGLVQGTAALARVEAFPARVVLQVLEALMGLQVKPSTEWLAACYAGLQVSARPPQMTAAGLLLSRLGWDPKVTMVSPSPPTPTPAPQQQAPPGVLLDSGTPAVTAAKSALSSKSSSSRSPEGSKSAGRTGSPTPSAPNSALEGMVGLLRDAASSGMLHDLRVTVFNQLEGCDPSLVLWTAEAFYQLGSPLTNRELARCVHLAASAINDANRESDVPAWDVLALVQRCCSQSAPIPPGQLEHLLEYVVTKRDQLMPGQLAELISAASAVVARSSNGSPMDESMAMSPVEQALAAAAQPAAAGIQGTLVYLMLEALRPKMGELTKEQAARVAGALNALRACGIAAAQPLTQWLNVFCDVMQQHLTHLNQGEMRQMLALLARSEHYPSDEFLNQCIQVARQMLPGKSGSAVPEHLKSSHAASTPAPDASSSPASSLKDVLAILELLVLDLGCPPSAQLAVDVATQLVPAVSAQADQLAPAELAGSLRLLAAMRCRPPPSAVQRLLAAVERYLFQLTPGRLAILAWTCAELGAVPKRAFLGRYLEAAAECLQEMGPVSLALLARSFSQLGVVPDASWQKAYRDAVLTRMPEADAETLSVLGQGLLHLGLRPDKHWLRSYLVESTYKLPEADAASMARFAHFAASSDVEPPAEWVQAIMERSVSVAPEEYDPPDLLPLVLRSLVHLGWAPEPSWLTEVLQHVSAGASQLQTSSLIITVTSVAALQHTSNQQQAAGDKDGYVYDTGVTFAALDTLLQAALDRVDEFSGRELRWLLDPVVVLHDYPLGAGAGAALERALLAKEAAEQRRLEQSWGGLRDQQEEEGDVSTCHNSIASGLNEYISDEWLFAAVMAV